MKIVALSDSPMQSGFGRISNEVFTRLVQRGHQVHVGSLLWDGVAMVDPGDWFGPVTHKYPFHISGLAGRDIWAYLNNLINLTQPDVVISLQDFPYAQTLYYNCRIDWSRRGFVVITPIDGEPIDEGWLRLVDDVDGTMVISEFGVAAMRRAGKRVGLCPPGIDTKQFYPATPDERKALRAKANIPENAFLVGMMAMNQGRKDIPHTLDGFAEFSKDKPESLLLMDMDAINPAGWNIKYLMKTKGIPEKQVLFREDLQKRGLTNLRDRYVILDAHSVLAHREGFGLPLMESQACKIPSIAMDWCSGTEICGNGQGYLIRRMPQPRNSTWGGALDYDPDVAHFAQTLETIYRHPLQAAAIAERGYEWAKVRSWDKATDNVEELLLEVERKNASKRGCANLQSATVRSETVPVNGSPSAETPEGGHPDGRQLNGVRPAGTDGTAIQRGAERTEPRVRRQLKQGGVSRQRKVRHVPELGHHSTEPVAGPGDGTDGGESENRSGGNQAPVSTE